MDEKHAPQGRPFLGVFALVCFGALLVASLYLVGVTQAGRGTRNRVRESELGSAENLLALESARSARSTARLHFEPSPAQVAVGSVAAVRLRLEDVDDLYGIEVHLAFDPGVVQVEDADASRKGVQIAAGEIPFPEFPVQNAADNANGVIDYAVTQLNPRPPASGGGVVATIHFRGMREGSSAIRFVSAKLASPDGVEISAILQDSSITVGAPTLTDTPTPTEMPGGPTHTPTPTAQRPTLTPGPTASAPTHTPRPTVPPSVPTQPAGPTATPVPPPPASSQCPTLYVARTGDTAFAVARRFGVSLDALATANGLSSSYNIKIGQLLTIPGVPGPTASTHVVQAGDTLYSIARRYGTSVETLAAVNRLPHPWHAPLGQTLLICPKP